MNFLDLVVRLLDGFGLLGPALVGVMTLAKFVQNLTKNQAVDWKGLLAELIGVFWLYIALLLVMLGFIVWAMSSQVSWPLVGLALCVVVTLWLGLEAFPHLRSKMQFPGWLGDVFFSCLLLGGAIIIFSEVSGAVSKALLTCEYRFQGTLAGGVKAGDARCVDYWLKQESSGASFGNPPLLYVAADGENASVLASLLASGRFDPNMPNDAGDTPLHVALQNGRHDMVCRLLAHGSNMHFPNSKNITPMELAARSEDASLGALFKGNACRLKSVAQ